MRRIQYLNKEIFLRKDIKLFFQTSFLLAFILYASVAKAAISVDVKPPVSPIHEPFEVIYTIENVSINSAPDFAPITKDFIILGTQSRSRYSNINGQISVVNQVVLTLMAKSAGVFTIPSLNFGPMKTPTARVEITTSQSNNQNTQATEEKKINYTDNYQDAVFLKTALTPVEGFLNQQFIYTVKLYNNGQLLDTEYHPPKVEDALIMPLSNSYRYHTIENGKNYIVEAQNYAVFPQKIGKLHVIGPVFHTLLYESMPNRVKLSGKTIDFNVQPIPAGFDNKNWLPARHANLQENYVNLKTSYEIGESVTRTITLNVTGLPAELVPDYTFTGNDDFDVYVDPPQLDNSIKQQDVQGTVKIKLTYILHKQGEITLPEIKIPWFNTVTQTPQELSLPARKVIVGNITRESNRAPDATVTKTKVSEDVSQVAASKNSQNLEEVKSKRKGGRDSVFRLPQLLLMLAGFLFAVVLYILFRILNTIRFKRNNYLSAYKSLEAACRKNDPLLAKDAVLLWFNVNGIQSLNLYDLADKINDPGLEAELKILGDIIYKDDKNLKSMWQGKSLLQNIKRYKFKKAHNKKKKNPLPDLYPDE